MKGKARWRAAMLLAVGVLVGVMMMVTPASAHVGGTVAHLVGHLKAYFYTKSQSNARFVNVTEKAARAYATVDPTAGTDGQFVAGGKTKKFNSIRRPSTGVYCLKAPGILPTNSPHFVTVEWGNSSGNALWAFNVNFNTFQCNADEFAVRTYTGVDDATGPTLSNSVGFQILVP
jgi:hypothetical protein